MSQEISTGPISKEIKRFTNKEEEEFIETEMQTSAVSAIIATEKNSTISVENVIDPYPISIQYIRENFECHSNLSSIYNQ